MMDVVEFMGHFGKAEFFVSKVDWDRYQVMDLYDDFKDKGGFYGIPKYFLLRYHPPNKQNIWKPLESDDDFANMRVDWEKDVSGIIHLFLQPLKQPSKPQATLECLSQFKQPTSQQNEPTMQPIEPIEPIVQPVDHPIQPIIQSPIQPISPLSPRKVLGVVKDKSGVKYVLPVADEEMSLSAAQKWATELIVTQPDGSSQILFEKPKKVTPKKKQRATESQPDSSQFRRPLTRSLGTPSSIQIATSQSNKHKQTTKGTSKPTAKHKGKEKVSESSIPNSGKLKGNESSSSRGPRFKPNFSAHPQQSTISLSGLGLDDFCHYDLEEICKEPSKYVSQADDDFFKDVEIQVAEGGDNGEDDNNSEWIEDENEEDYTSEEDEVNLEEENEIRQQFGRDTGDEDDNNIVVNKMAKVFKKGQMWKRNSDGMATLKVGDIFTTKEDLLSVVKDVCIQGGFELKKIKSSKTRYTQTCAHKGCTWRLHCSVVVDRYTWMVKTISGEHITSCGPVDTNKMADSKWLCNKMIESYRMSKDLEVSKMQENIRKAYGIKVEDWTCWRAKKLMKALVEGKHEDGYKYIPAYCEEFTSRNPESVCLVNWINQGPDRPPMFKSLVICIGPACHSFVGYCRPLIGIDATHLKGPYRGVLLTAMGLDGNNGQFPLAYSVVEKENEEAWTYFLRGLIKALGCVEDQSRYTVISDRHWGIVKALESVMPTANRRLCVLHYYKNFATQYPGAWYHTFFYMAANTHADFVYRRAMEIIKAKDQGAYDWLVFSEKPKLWARNTFDPTLKCEDNTNNFVESFNHAIIKFRGRPVLTMLEDIRKLIGRRFVKRFEMAQKWTSVFVPFVDKKVKELAGEGRGAKVTHMGDLRFDVEESVDVNFTVNLNEKFCNCNKWQITGIPCKHATRCILDRKQQIQDYCDPCYTVDVYKNLYNHVISPIPSPIMWQPRELPLLDPPHAQIRKGRPPLHKRRESTSINTKEFGSATLRCSKCKMLGHNRTTCGRPRDEYERLVQKRSRPPPTLDEHGRPKKRGRKPKQATPIATQQSQAT